MKLFNETDFKLEIFDRLDKCPYCQSEKLTRLDQITYRQDKTNYRMECESCKKQFIMVEEKEKLEYFECCFKNCPYCNAGNLTKIELLCWMGGHQDWKLECPKCKKRFNTSNRQTINWQIPKKNKCN